MYVYVTNLSKNIFVYLLSRRRFWHIKATRHGAVRGSQCLVFDYHRTVEEKGKQIRELYRGTKQNFIPIGKK